MPIYEYICTQDACAAHELRQEIMKSFSQMETPEFCTACGKEMTRAMSIPARAQFNAGGFYETMYGPKSGKKK